MSESTSRLAGLDTLRALAFLAVFVHHALGAPMLWAGVDVFFVLSGFLITGILRRTATIPGSLRTFYGRRFMRIVPPYYLVLFVILACLPGSRSSWPWYVSYTSNLHDSFAAGPEILAPMWSLAIEEQFYLVWPLLVLTTSRRHLAWICGFLIAGCCAGRLAGSFVFDDWRPIYHLTFLRLDLLAAGALISVLLEGGMALDRRLQRWAVVMTGTGALAFLALAWTVPGFRTTAHSPVFNSVGYSLVGVTAVGLLLIVLSAGGATARLLALRPLVYLGQISYVTYLVHVPAIRLARELVAGRLAAAALAGGLTVLIAALSQRLLERPLLILKERWFSYRRSPAPQ